MNPFGTITLAAVLALAALPARGGAETVRIVGGEGTSLIAATTGDGSVRTVAAASFDGMVANVEGGTRLLGAARFVMTTVVSGNELKSATIAYTQSGRRDVTVTIDIDPCWFELVNDRDFTAEDFGADIREKVEAAMPEGTLDRTIGTWLAQRLSLLAARMAVPLVKSGTLLVPPRG